MTAVPESGQVKNGGGLLPLDIALRNEVSSQEVMTMLRDAAKGR